jgi:hypothetical protein
VIGKNVYAAERETDQRRDESAHDPTLEWGATLEALRARPEYTCAHKERQMAFDHETRIAKRLLDVVENGILSTADIRPLYEAADPALVYLIFAWLRVRYHAGHSASEGVLGRIVALCSASTKVTRMAREGEHDSIVTWFEETHDYRDFDRNDFISLVVEKLEG